MTITFVLLKQVFSMLILSGVGLLMYKTGKISLEGSKSLGNILIYASLPCVIIKGFIIEYTSQRMKGLIYSAILAIIILLLSIAISRVFFSKDAIAGFAAAFSNPGFLGYH